MRKYTLTITPTNGKEYLFNGGSGFETSGSNIEFTIPYYADATTIGLPTTFKIYNPPLELFFKARDFAKYNPIITLFAGWEVTPIFMKTGIATLTKEVSSIGLFGLIYNGTIQACVPNYEDLTTPSVMLACTPTPATKTIKTHTMTINKIINPIELIAWLKKFTTKRTNFIPDKSLLKIQFKNTKILSANDFYEATKELRGLNIFLIQNKLNIYTIYYRKPKIIDKLHAINTPPKVSTSAVKPTEINAQQIIGLPQVIDAVSVRITIALNYRMKVGNLVYLDPIIINKFAFSGNDLATLTSVMLIGASNDGLFRVVSCEHVGEFRSADATKWSTSMTLTRSF